MTTTPEPTTMTFRTPEDVLAAVPVLLGFEPSESVVMLTFGGRETFHARVDIPPPQDLGDAVDLLLGPAVAHGVTRVLLVVYSRRRRLAERLHARLREAFEQEGIGLVMALRTDGRRWSAPGGPGVPYDVGTHPFRVESVLRGDVVTSSRDELAARLAPTAAVGAVEVARANVPGYDATEVAVTIWRAVERGRFDDADLAGVLQGIRDESVRDAAWGSMTRAESPAHVLLWTDAVQRAPRDLVGGAAAVLALASWVAGNGALAWCAVDRCLECDPDNTLAALVGELLSRAVPPSSWERT